MLRASQYHAGRRAAAERIERRGGSRNRVMAGLVFFDDDGERLVSLDPVDVCRRLQAREPDDREG